MQVDGSKNMDSKGSKTLLEKIRAVKITAEDRESQRRSFAYGNTKIENDRITREIVNRAADELEGTKSKK
jgi:hypothetical protein